MSFTRIYPKIGRMTLDAGLNNKFERSIISDGESPDCLNVVFRNRSVGTRPGSSKLNTTAIGSFVLDGLKVRRDNDGTSETMIAFAGGSGWFLSGTTFSTIPSAQSVFTSGFRVAAAQQEDHLFIGNGGVIPYKWNGVDFTRHGVYPPTTTAAVASAATGAALASGSSYTYKFTFVNSQLVESDVGPAVTHNIAANSMGNVAITNIPVAPTSWGISSRRIYRTVAGGATFKRVATISDNSTTSYDDAITDANLGATAPTDNGVPPKYSTIAQHAQRLFCNDPANPSFVWFSNLGEPYTFASTNFLVIGDDAGNVVKGIAVYNDGIVVRCEKATFLIYMPSTDESEWQVIKLLTEFGSKSPHCVIDYNNKQLFPAVLNGKFAGFAALSGNSVDPGATRLTTGAAGSELKSDRIEPDMFDVQESFMGNISGITYKNNAYITLTKGSGQTQNNRIYTMDFSMANLAKDQVEAWAPWSGLNISEFAIYNGSLYGGSSTANGFVYQLETNTYNDSSSAINSYFWTKEFSGYEQDFNFHKDFRYANLLIDKPGAYYMNVVVRVDSDVGDGTTYQIPLNPGGSLWGSMVWGVDVWGGGSSQEDYTLDLGNAAGKRLQLKFTNQNTADQRFKVHGMNFTYNVKGRR